MQNKPPIIEHLPSEIIKFEYSGEETRHCPGCNEFIEEGKMVVTEPFYYNGKLMSDFWHPECWEDADVTSIPDVLEAPDYQQELDGIRAVADRI